MRTSVQESEQRGAKDRRGPLRSGARQTWRASVSASVQARCGSRARQVEIRDSARAARILHSPISLRRSGDRQPYGCVRTAERGSLTTHRLATRSLRTLATPFARAVTSSALAVTCPGSGCVALLSERSSGWGLALRGDVFWRPPPTRRWARIDVHDVTTPTLSNSTRRLAARASTRSFGVSTTLPAMLSCAASLFLRCLRTLDA